jgi:hypothetical protein
MINGTAIVAVAVGAKVEARVGVTVGAGVGVGAEVGVGSTVGSGIKVGNGVGVAHAARTKASAIRKNFCMAQGYQTMNNETIRRTLRVNNEQIKTPNPNNQTPKWLWRLARWSFVILVLVIAAMVIAVALGAGDPKPMGSLRWEDRLDSRARWQTFGDELFFGSGGLVINLKQKGDTAGAVTSVEATSQFTLEAAASQANGEPGAFYGIIFNFRDPDHYTAVMINGNGYVEVFEIGGKVLMPQQEWPNILLGNESNRVRVDASNGEGLIRINDEVLLRLPITGGDVGIVARASAANQRVRFSWVKLWK